VFASRASGLISPGYVSMRVRDTPLAAARAVRTADRPELFVRNEQHAAAAVSVVNLEQLRPLAALTRAHLNGAAVAVPSEDSLPRRRLRAERSASRCDDHLLECQASGQCNREVRVSEWAWVVVQRVGTRARVARKSSGASFWIDSPCTLDVIIAQRKEQGSCTERRRLSVPARHLSPWGEGGLRVGDQHPSLSRG
jgi:hypothetical protein